MINVVKAVYSQMANSSLASSSYCGDRIFYGVAPFNTVPNNTKYKVPTFPYIVFIKVDEEVEHTQISTLETYQFQVDIYDNDTSAITLETMAGLLKTLFGLKSATFSITGYTEVSIKPVSGHTLKTQENNWRHTSRYQIEITK